MKQVTRQISEINAKLRDLGFKRDGIMTAKREHLQELVEKDHSSLEAMYTAQLNRKLQFEQEVERAANQVKQSGEAGVGGANHGETEYILFQLNEATEKKSRQEMRRSRDNSKRQAKKHKSSKQSALQSKLKKNTCPTQSSKSSFQFSSTSYHHQDEKLISNESAEESKRQDYGKGIQVFSPPSHSYQTTE